jgi:hypothetical protein
MASAGDAWQTPTRADPTASVAESGELQASAAEMLQDDAFRPSLSQAGWTSSHGTGHLSSLRLQQVAAMMRPPAGLVKTSP